MKMKNKMITSAIAFALIIGSIGLTPLFAAESSSGKITAENYEENREQMEKEINGDNLIDRTTQLDYTFGAYGRVHVDGWNVSILNYSIDEAGVHSVTVKADEGYRLPVGTKTSHFMDASEEGTERGRKFTINQDGTGTLTFTPTARFSPDTLAKTSFVGPVLVRMAALPDNENTSENTYNSDYAFMEVSHVGIAFGEAGMGISYQLNGSRTYWLKKNTPLKVYYVSQANFKPIETQSPLYKTGVSYQHDDYRNRYLVIPGSKGNSYGAKLTYDSTLFNSYVYSYTQGKYIKLNTYEFYNQNNTISMPSADLDVIQYPGMRVVGYKVYNEIYAQTMANKVTIDTTAFVGFDYVLNTKASDYNVQWTATGIDNGGTQYTYSSLRHRAGNVKLMPLYQYEYTVKFFDQNGEITSATQKVLKNEAAIAPADPVRENYTFEGWDIAFNNVQSDLEVHAIFKEIPVEEPTPETVTVNFVDFDGTPLKQEVIEKGKNATPPTVAQRDGYRFIGWDQAYENVQEDITVTALYEAIVAPVPPVDPGTPDVPQPPVEPQPGTPTVTEPNVPTTVVDNTPTQAITTPVEEETVTVNVTPKAKGTDTESVKEKETPLAKGLGGSWALINLVCVWLTIIIGMILLLSKHNKEEDQDDEKQANTNADANVFTRRRWTKVAATLVAILSLVVFIFTEDITLPMQMTDQYTIAMVIIVLVQVAVMLVGRKWKTNEDEESQKAEA